MGTNGNSVLIQNTPLLHTPKRVVVMGTGNYVLREFSSMKGEK
jgi:hypothetical protein